MGLNLLNQKVTTKNFEMGLKLVKETLRWIHMISIPRDSQ